MQREIIRVRRCARCQTVLQALVDDVYLGDDGEEARACFWLPRRVHTEEDCNRMLTMAEEEWPVLFEISTEDVSPRYV